MRVRRDEPTEEIFLNLTAFIDMMLVLVIFFLATSRFHEEERDEAIRLAKSRSSLPIANVSDTLVINIDKEGRKVVDGRARTQEELEEVVRSRRAQRQDTEVVVRGDVRGLYGPIAETVELCVRLGFKTPTIAYEKAGQ
jgi:biopolymer transport protein ExbD